MVSILAYGALTFGFSCQFTTTENLLNGEFSGTDTTAPLLLSPKDKGVVVGLTAQLFWSAKSGTDKYTVEVSRSADFSLPIAGSPFTASGTSLSVTLPDTAQYWWRVKAPFTKGSLNVANFDAITDAVYVYCPENQTCSDNGRGGSKANPYQSISAALGAAKVLGVPVRVASRGTGGQSYAEAISLIDGVALYGGYDAQFSEAGRNAATNVTEITAGAIPLTASFITQNTIVDGFKITGQNAFALYLDNSNANLTIRNSTITSGDVNTGNAHGVYCKSSSATLTGNTITAGGAINAGGSGLSYGIYNDACNGLIINNTIIGGMTASSGGSYGIFNTNGSSPTISNNTILSGTPATGPSIGISITGSSGNASNPKIVNNIILSKGGGGTRTCIAETGSAGQASPNQLRNNLLFSCTNLYTDSDGGGTITAVTGITTVNSCVTCATTTSGNVTITVGQNPFVNLAGNNFRLQNNGSPMTAQEWQNVAYGGADTSAALLGSVISDRDGASRTATAAGALNTGAAGYSIGAYEY